MTITIDTNVLVGLWDADDAMHRMARQALDATFGTRLVISGVVYAELLAAPGRSETFLDKFCEDAGIVVDWDTEEKVWRAAGRAFQEYVARRKKQKGGEARRLLADFLIGAHAEVNGYTLLTLDEGMYRGSFPRLKIVAV
ncbi:MAG TPA: type II toxin-antitoxin system VapC family toxin [Candidatus Acidoferrum sp.]